MEKSYSYDKNDITKTSLININTRQKSPVAQRMSSNLRDDSFNSQLNQDTYDNSYDIGLLPRNLKNQDEIIEEKPRGKPMSPTKIDSTNSSSDHKELATLLDDALKAQDKYVKMFPDMKHRINDIETKSIEDMTFTILNQGIFIYEQYK